MGFFSDLFESNFGNLGHDIAADPVAEGGLLAGGALLTGGLLAPELFAGAGGLFGAGEAGGLAGSALAGAEVGGAAGGELGLGLAGGGGALSAIESAVPTPGTPSSALGFSGNLTESAVNGPGFSMPALDPNTGLPLSSPGVFDPTSGAGGGWGGAMTGGAGAADAGSLAAGGSTDPLISQILSTEKGFVQGLPDASGGGGGGSLLDSITGQITKNPLGIAAAGAGLGLNLLQGNKTDPALAQEQALAKNAQDQAAQMQKYLQSGTLPPGLQSAVDQAVAARKAQIIQNHAAQGQSTDPTQNSALAQELSSIDLQATGEIAKIATGLYTQGVKMFEIDADLLNKIYNADMAQNKQMGDALTNFAKALAPSGPTLLKVGGTG